MKNSLLKLTARICLCIQISGLFTGAFVPLIAEANNNAVKHKALFASNTALYVLENGDTVESVARKFGLNVAELKKLNEFRTFSKPFEQLGAGDEIDVPTPQSATPANDSGEVIGSSLNNSRNEKLWAQTSTTLGTALSSDDPRQSAANVAGSMVTGAASSATQDWLAQFGTARVDLNVDDKFHLDDSSIDFLLPLYDTPSNLFFTQLGYRHKDDRNTVNLGLGYRRFEGNWMYGINSFYDDDVTGGNRRIGIGFEAWTDYLKLSANGYRGLTDWHQSRDFEDYDERPADGFDIRAEGWLPAYPQLGGKIVYEKYYGNNVALIDKDTLKHNPVAVTFGVNYTPIPLLTFGVDHQQGEGGDNDTTFNLELNYRLGEPWSKQIDPAMVDSTRTLAGTRYDLVERNNDIVLDYKKQNLIQLGLPDYQTGNAGETGIITAKINAKYGAERVEWHEESAFFTAGGKAESTGAHGETLKITYPSYINSGSHDMNLYHISAVAYDTRGNKSNNGTTDIQVLKADESTVGIADGDLTVGDNNAVANGTATDSVVAKVTDANSNPVSGVEVTFSAGNGAKVAKETIATGSDGTATTTLTSTTAGAVTVTAKAGESEQNVDVNFTADSDTAEITDANLSVGTGAVADGEQTNAISAIVTDANGNPIANQAVTFSVAEGATITTTQGTTGADGKAAATVTSETAGTYAVTASVNGKDISKDTTFVADNSTAIVNDLVVKHDDSVATGKATDGVVATAIVIDGNGNPVTGQEVVFDVTEGATLTTVKSVTGKEGKAAAVVTAKAAGVYKVTARTNRSMKIADVHFVANSSTASVAELVIGHDNSATSGKVTDGVTATAVVVDENGNPVSGEWVIFRVTKGATITAVKGITGVEGRATAVVTSQKAGTYRVTAEVNGSTAHNDAHFVADSDTAGITDGNLNVGTGAVADGKQTNAVSAIVTDATGNPVANQVVTFSVAKGATLTTTQGTTGADGKATATVTSKTAGTYAVTASVNGKDISKNTTFVADDSTAEIADGNLVIGHDNTAASGKAADGVTATATVTDKNGNPVPGLTVDFTVARGATITTVKGTTGAEGRAAAVVTSQKAGTYTVTAKVNGSTARNDAHFVADSDTAKITDDNLSVGTGAVADGKATNAVSAIVTDANGNPVANQEVTFSVAQGAAITTTQGTTGADGKASATVTSKTAGTYAATASVNGRDVSKNTTFVADDSTAEIADGNLTVGDNNAVANGTATDSVVAKVTDANSNPVSGVEVTFTANNGANVVTETVPTGTDGTATTTLTSTTAGAVTVTAMAGESKQSVDVNFTADSDTAEITDGNLVIGHDNTAASGKITDGVTATATVTDSNGNPVLGQWVTFTVTKGATITTVKGITGTEGRAAAVVTSQKAGTYTVTAEVNGSTASNDAHFVADSDTAEITDANLSVGTGAVADGNQTNAVSAIVTDANGNPVANQDVTFSVAQGATITTTQGKTGADGKATATVTSKKAGTYAVTASVNGRDVSKNTTFVADDSTAEIADGHLTVGDNNAVANGTATDSVVAKVTDANSNPVSGIKVTFSANNGANVMTETVPTGADGTATTTLTSTTAGAVTVTAKAGDSEQTVNVNFTADEPANMEVTITNNNAVANGNDMVLVRAMVRDAQGNPVKDSVVTFAKMAPGGSAQISQVHVTTNDHGVASTTLTDTVAETVGLDINMMNSEGNQSIANEQYDITFTADDSTAEITDANLSVGTGAVANGKATNAVTAKVTDKNGNPVASQTVTFSVAEGAVITQREVQTGADGNAGTEVTSLKAGTYAVTASVNGKDVSKNTTFVADSGTAEIADGNLTVVDNNAIANGTATDSVQAKVTDANGNPVSGVEVTFSAGNGANVMTETVPTGADGTATTTLTSTTAGAVTVTAKAGDSEQTVDVNFTADDSTAEITDANLSVGTGAVANGKATNAVTAKVTDKNGNPVASQTVTFSVAEGAVITQREVQTGADGNAGTEVTSLKAGTYAVTASVNGKDVSKNTTFVADSGTAEIADGNLTVVDNNAIANGTATDSVQAKVTDANGNPVSGVEVTFSAGNGANVMTETVPTGADGTATTTLTSTTAGAVTVTAKAGDSEQTVNVNFTADEPANMEVTITNNNAVANGNDMVLVRAMVRDAQGNPVKDSVVTFAKMAPGGSAQISQVHVTTNDHGVASTTLTDTVAETVGLDINMMNSEGNQSIANEQYDITFTADDSTAEITDANLSVGTGAVANGKATNAVTAKVTDKNGNPVASQTVTFSVAEGAVITQREVQTGADGNAGTEVTSLKAGTYAVTASVNGKDVSKNTTFVADSGTAEIADGNLTVVDNNAIANGTATDSVQAKVTDANGNPVSGVEVTFSAGNGANVMTETVPTGADGTATTTLTSTTAGAVTVTAKAGDSEQTVDVNFTADDSTAEITDANLSVGTGAVANGKATNAVTAKVTDKNGNPVASQTVTFSVAEGAVITQREVQTGADGNAGTEVTSLKAGTYAVTASVNGKDVSKNTTFVADSGTAEIADGNLTVVDNNAIANGTATDSVQAKVTDANGNPVSGVEVTFSAGNGANVMTETVPTGADGTATTTLTSTTAGAVTVTAKAGDSEQTVDVNFTADDSTAEITDANLSVGTGAVANGKATNAVTAKVTDKNGNPVASQTVTFSVAEGAVITQREVQTGADGNAGTEVTSLKAGTYAVTASVNGKDVSKNTTFVADSGTAEIADGNLTVVDNNAIANGTATDSVQAKVTDANGNPVSGVEVTFSAGNGANVMTETVPTGADGTATTTLTSTTAGAVTVTAKAGDSEQTVDVNFTADDSTAEITDANLSVGTGAVANGKATNAVTAKVTDKNGNPVASQTVTFSVAEGAVITQREVQTGADGNAGTEVTSLKAGTYAVTASVNGKDVSKNTTFVADSGTAEIADGNLTVVDNNAIANGTATDSVQAKVTDANGNPVSGVEVTFSAGNGANVMTETVPTGADGTATTTLTSTTAGAVTVTAKAGDSEQTVDVNFTADDSTAEITDANLSVGTGAVANGKATNAVTAKVTDKNGNPVASQTVTFSVAEGAVITQREVQTGADGNAGTEVTSLKAGTYAVTASVNGKDVSKNTTFVADSGTAEIADGNLTVVDNNAIANGTATDSVQAKVTDANGNPVSGVEVTFSAGNGANVMTETVPTGADGTATTTLTSTTAGAVTVTAKAGDSEQTVDVNFTADDSTAEITDANLSVGTGAVANGKATNAVTAKVTDKNGNPVASQTVTFSVAEGAVITQREVQTGADGNAGTEVTSLKAGTYAVTASVNGKDVSKNTTFVADSGTAEIADGNLTVVDNNAIANGTATDSVQAKVTDANGNPVSGVEVTFSAGNGANVMTETVPTGADGTATTTLTSTTAGAVTVTAKAGDSEQTVDVNFTADDSTAEITDANLSVGTGAVANGKATNAVTAKVTDKNGNPVASQTVTFSVAEGAVITQREVQTGADGNAGTEVTSLKAGTYAVTASVNGKDVSKNTTFVADSGTAEIADGNLTVVDNNAIANGTATDSVQAKVTDANGNPVSGVEVTFSAGNGANVMTETVPTGADGTATTTLTSTTAGAVTVTAKAGDSEQTVDVNFTADDSTAEITDANLSVGTGAVANGKATNAVTAKVTDKNGNPVASQTVTFSVAEGAVITQREVQTGADGNAGTEVTSLKAGTYAVTASVNGKDVSKNTTFVADSGTAEIADGNLSVGSGAVADGKATNAVSAIVTDANGNPVANQKVTFQPSGGPIATPSSATSGADGKVTTMLTSTIAGTFQFTAFVENRGIVGHTTFVEEIPVTIEVTSLDYDRATHMASCSYRVHSENASKSSTMNIGLDELYSSGYPGYQIEVSNLYYGDRPDVNAQIGGLTKKIGGMTSGSDFALRCGDVIKHFEW